MLTFYEEIMVLLLHDENGTFLPVSEHTLNRALTGAVPWIWRSPTGSTPTRSGWW